VNLSSRLILQCTELLLDGLLKLLFPLLEPLFLLFGPMLKPLLLLLGPLLPLLELLLPLVLCPQCCFQIEKETHFVETSCDLLYDSKVVVKPFY
jgi:hypothetical protein